MEKAVYLLLIFCGTFSQGICNNQENKENSSDLLIRQKRVVGGIPRPFEASPYLLHVVENGNFHCPVTLLTADVAISTAVCFINQNPRNMKIVSRSLAGEQLHEIVRVIFLDPNFNQDNRTSRNLALVRFAPINFRTSRSRPITLYSGHLAAEHSRSPALVVGWGRPRNIGSARLPAETLRSISVLVISFEYCQELYPESIHLWNICGVGVIPGDSCDNRDNGSPLIMNHQLLGIFVYRSRSRISNPNVFINLLDNGIRRWIHEHVPSLRLF